MGTLLRVCLGGTFHPFHAGHEALLDAALAGADEVFVGITSGDLAQRPDREVPPLEKRAAAIREYVQDTGWQGTLTTRPIEDAAGPSATGDYDAIVVSPETIPGARRINQIRTQSGLQPLALRVVPHVLGQDLLPISATRIAAGRIDRHGRRRGPVIIAVGSQNPVKVAAVEEEMADLLRLPVEVHGVAAGSGVPEQPKDEETLQGARTRARNAMATHPAADYAVGVEAGLSQDPARQAWYDVQACVVVDATGHETDGWGPAFQYPAWVTRRALAGEMVSEILGPVAKDPRIGGTTGAIGYLTDGHMDRTRLTRQAVAMAFVPRIRRGLYQVEPR